MPSINKTLDLANAFSLKYLLPMGAHDLDCMEGDLEVRFSRQGDIFTPFGQEESEELGDGEIVYADGLQVRTRRGYGGKANWQKLPGEVKMYFPHWRFY